MLEATVDAFSKRSFFSRYLLVWMVDGYLDVIPPVAQRERVPDALEREAPSLSKTPWFSQHLSCLVVSASSVTSTGL